MARQALAKSHWRGNRGEIAAAVSLAEDAVRMLGFGEDPFVDSAPSHLIRGYDYLDRPAEARAAHRSAIDRWAPNPVMQQVVLAGAIAARSSSSPAISGSPASWRGRRLPRRASSGPSTTSGPSR